MTSGPVTTANKLSWTAPANAPTAAEAQSLAYLVYIDNAPVTGNLPNVSCSGTPVSCAANLTSDIVQKLNAMGQHAIELVAVHTTGGESPRSIPFALKSPPGAPTAVRLSR